MGLIKKIEFKWWALTALVIIGTLWKCYPHFMIAELLPSDEYNNWVLLEVMIREGRAFDFLLSPQLQYYFMYLVNRVTGIGSIELFRWTNGIIGGCSVLAFFYFCSSWLDENEALMACFLYTFSEPIFYRSCFLGSTEILGITLMFITLGLYLRKRYIFIPFVLGANAFVHLAPFVFSIMVMIGPYLTNRKTIAQGLALVVVALFVVFGPFSPHRKQKFEILSTPISSFSLDNLFIYSIYELAIIGGVSYLGTVILGLCTLPEIKKWSKIEHVILLSGIGIMAISWIGYNAMVFSPRRALVYLTIPLLTFGGKMFIKPRHFPLLVPIFVGMVLGPLLMGTQSFVWVNDSITQSELDAIDWLVENNYFNRTEWYMWFSDRPITQAINPHIFFLRPERDPASASVSSTTQLEEINEFVGNVHKEYDSFITSGMSIFPTNTTDPDPLENKTDPIPPSEYSWKYILISERMKKQSFYLVRDPDGGTRSKEIRIPTIDVWKDDPWFDEIYNVNGVIIYEKRTD